MRSVYERNRNRLALLLGLLLLSGTASADLITNGGFETGDLTGWTASGDTLHIFVCGAGSSAGDCGGLQGFLSSSAPHSGNDALAFGPDPSGSISQTLNTVATQSYDISFWLETCPDAGSCTPTPNSLTATFGGTTLMSDSNIVLSVWHQFVFDNVTATSSSTAFTISGLDVHSFFLIDDISVNPSTPSSVPEPSAFALLLTAVGAVGFLARRRRPYLPS
jgi:hypothetical protein